MQTSSQTSPTNPTAANAATANLGFVSGLQDKGFTPYTGQMVAPFSGQQQSSFAMGNQLASSGVPNVAPASTAIGNAAGVGPQSVTPSTISSQMSPYMNAYVGASLQPQLQAQAQLNAAQNKSFDSSATGSGAFGDTSWALGRGNLTNQQNIAGQGLVGNAYNSAFNTAIGAGAQDVSNSLTAQTTNANLANTYAGQQLGVGQAYQGLGNYQVGTGTALTNLQNTLGGQQTAQTQAGLNAAYNQYLQAQQYPFQTAQLYNQSISAATPSMGTTTQAPNNAGYGLLGAGIGALGGAMLAPMTGGMSMLPSMMSSANFANSLSGNAAAGGSSPFSFSDPALKENIERVGKLDDGTPIHRYNFKGSPQTQIGLLSTDVEKKTPDAVNKSGPFDMVDYRKATEKAAKKHHAHGGVPALRFGLAA
jgi:hypothetical protein